MAKGVKGLWVLAVGAVLVAGGLMAVDFIDVQRAKRVVGASLFDPSSAQYRDVDQHGQFLCGEVNAKNRLGGYIGYRKFRATFDPPETEFEPVQTEGISTSVAGMTAYYEQQAEISRFQRDWYTLCSN